MFRLLLSPLILAVCFFLSSTAVAQTASSYEVYALRYGAMADSPVAGLAVGADPSRKIDIALVFWLVRGNGRNVLVDAGFYRQDYAKGWKIKDYVRPDEVLARVGVKPEDVTDVIVTHMHFDHADGADLFPKARIWVQRDEYTYYTGEAWHAAQKPGAVDPEGVLAMVKKNIAGHVSFVEGDAQQIIPGITCYTGGRHTFQSQYVAVHTAHGTVVLASDNMYLYENLDRHVPIGATFDAASNLKAQDRMRTLATKPEWIIPGHDPAQFERFPKVAEGVVKVE